MSEKTKKDYTGDDYWTTNPIQQAYNLAYYPLGSEPGKKKDKTIEVPLFYDIKPGDNKYSLSNLSGYKFKHHKTGKMIPIEGMTDKNTKFGSTFITVHSPYGGEKQIRNPYTSGAVTDFPLLPAQSLLGALGLNYFETIPMALAETGHPLSAIATGLSPWTVPAAGRAALKKGGQVTAKTFSNLGVMGGYDPLSILKETSKVFRSDPVNALRAIWHDYPMNPSLLNIMGDIGRRGSVKNIKDHNLLLPVQAGDFRHLFGLPRYPKMPPSSSSYAPKGIEDIRHTLRWMSPALTRQGMWDDIAKGYDVMGKANPMYKMSYKGIKDYPHAYWNTLPRGLQKEAEEWLDVPYDHNTSLLASTREGYKGSGLGGSPDYHDVLGEWGPFGNFLLTRMPRVGSGRYPKGTGVDNIGYEDISTIALNSPEELAALKKGMLGLGKTSLSKLNPFGKESRSWGNLLNDELRIKAVFDNKFGYPGGDSLGSLLSRWIVGKTATNNPIRNLGEFEILRAPGYMQHPLKHWAGLKEVGGDIGNYTVPRFAGHAIPPKSFLSYPWSKGYLESFGKGKQSEYMVDKFLEHWSGVGGRLTDEVTGKLTKQGESFKKALAVNEKRKEAWDNIVAEAVKKGGPLSKERMYDLKTKFNRNFLPGVGVEDGLPSGILRRTKKDYSSPRFGVYRMANPTAKEVDYWQKTSKFWDLVNDNKYSGVRRFGQRYRGGADFNPAEVGSHAVDKRLTGIEFKESYENLREIFRKKVLESNLTFDQTMKLSKKLSDLKMQTWTVAKQRDYFNTLSESMKRMGHTGQTRPINMSFGRDPVVVLKEMETLINSVK